MRCGNYKQIVKIFLLLCLCLFSGYSVACQSKPKDVAAVLQPCQELVDKEDLLAVGKCYNEQLAANPQFAVEMEATFSKSFFKKCLELKEKENYEKAIVCLEGVSVLNPNSANIRFLLADSYYEYNKTQGYRDFDLLELAEQSLNIGLRIKSDDASAYGLYGQISEQKGESRNALGKYQKATELAPKVEVYWMKLALIQEKISDSSSSLISYYRALQINPKNTLTLYNSAKLYEKTGNVDQAIINFERLLAIKKPYDDTEDRLENLKNQKSQPKGKTKP